MSIRTDFEAWYREKFADDPNSIGALSEWLAYQAATERAAKQERADGVLIAAYALPVAPGIIEQVRIERARQMFGPDLWAVRRNGDVLNKQGEWEWEPMPSSRDDAFLARARFATSEEAIAAAIRNNGSGNV